MKTKLDGSMRIAIYVIVVVVILGSWRYWVNRPNNIDENDPKQNNATSVIVPQTVNDTLADQVDNDSVLRLLIWGGYAPYELVKEFERDIEKQTGQRVTLQIIEVESSDDFFGPVREKKVDLITLSHHDLKDDRFNYIEKKLVLPPDLNNIPNFVHLRQELRDADYHLVEGIIYGIPIGTGTYGLAYNTQRVETKPDSWKIFWEPEFKKKYVLGAHEYLYNVNITALALGYPRESISNFDVLNNSQFREKLRELALNAKGFWMGVDTPQDLVGMSLGTAWGDSFSELRRQGETWKMADPQEGTLWWVDECVLTWALIDRPFMKQVAEAWINKTLSIEFQVDHLIREVGIYPVINDIDNTLTLAEKEHVQFATQENTAHKRILQQIHSQRDRNGLMNLWENAMKGVVLDEGTDQ